MSRDPDMGLLNVKPEELEKLLNHMNENGLYRPTVNDILEAHGETTIIANIKEDIKSIKSSETSLQSDISVQLLTLAQVTRDIKNLKDKQERAQKMLEDEQKNSSKQMNSIYTVNESDFSTLESSKTSLTWSIAGWSIFSIVILILAAILYITVNNFRYQINTLYSAFNATNRNALRRLIIDFFTQYKLNILSNSAIQTANPQNPA
jgi:predicted PurR-regulated permease PerM